MAVLLDLKARKIAERLASDFDNKLRQFRESRKELEILSCSPLKVGFQYVSDFFRWVVIQFVHASCIPSRTPSKWLGLSDESTICKISGDVVCVVVD